jgi:anti-sigma B factor antagonist
MKIYSEGPTLHVTDLNELNATNAPALRDNVRTALKSETSAIELDMSDSKFIDSSGLGSLIALQKTMASRQGILRIVNPTSTVVQVLELTRLHRVLEIVRR